MAPSFPRVSLPAHTHDRQALVRAFREYARPYRGAAFVALLAGIVSMGAQVATPTVIKTVVDLVNRLATHATPAGDASHLWWLGAVLVALAAVSTLSNFLRRTVSIRLSMHIDAQMRNDLYAHLQRLPLSFHGSWQSGQLISRAINDLGAMRRFLSFGAIFFVTSGLTFVAVFALLFTLDAPLAALSTVIVLPVFFITRHFGKVYRVISRDSQNRQGELNTVIEEAATGVRIIKAYGRQAHIASTFDVEAEALRQTMLRGVGARAANWSSMHLLPSIAVAMITLVGGLAVIDGHLSIGGLVAFTAYLAMLIAPMDLLGWVVTMLEEAATAATRVYEVLDTVPAIADRPGATDLVPGSGHLAFDDVWFGHGDSADDVIRGVSLDIRPGETMALVGRTGSGKTTLASLVSRLNEPTRGRILLDGQDTAMATLDSLRAQVAVAFEDPVLFSASVRENLLMGRADATDEEIEAALTVAQARFVLDLPWGLDTRIGEQGYTLSGGQRQRLALARAIIGQPRVLVLDDPLSSVDVHTEAVIERALADVLEGATALLVVHRPSTLVLADRVALLDGGRIVAVGTHHQLMQENQLYAAILAEGDPGGTTRVAMDADRAGDTEEVPA